MSEPNRIILLTVTHTVLLSVAVYVESGVAIANGWAENRILLVLYILAPLIAGALMRQGRNRQAGLLLLPFMAAGVVTNGGFLQTLFELHVSGWVAIYSALLASLIICEAVAAAAAIAVLHRHHQSARSNAGASS